MIPFDLVYEHILNLSDRKITVFFLKNLNDRGIDNWDPWTWRSDRHRRFWPVVYAHDQELLDFDRYDDSKIQGSKVLDGKKGIVFVKDLNLKWLAWANIYDKAIITHSEKNSQQVEKYKTSGFEPVYFWSHAIIARDWFRYAKHDPLLDCSNIDHLPWYDFLVYSRGWQGSREYRLLMADMMIERGLLTDSNYSILHAENGRDLDEYIIQDPRYQNIDLEKIKRSIRPCTAPSDSSARYDRDDFLNSAISVVLETNFSDGRVHLTEKILRSIALGHPFILAAGPGSLDYLRSYGFKTYAPYINESYDTENDPVKRLKMICDEMDHIRAMAVPDKKNLYKNLRQIALENRRWFFSEAFESQVIDELQINFKQALDAVRSRPFGTTYLENSRQRRLLMGADYLKDFFREKRRTMLHGIRTYRKKSN